MACSKAKDEVPGPGNESEEGSGDGSGNESNEKQVISFTANIPAFMEENSRTTVDNDWKDLENRTIAVEIDGVVKSYTVDENGNMTSESPFLWEGRENVTVSAWYPFTDGGKIADELLTVMADQSKPENFVASDYLETVATTVTPTSSVLSFSHRVAKLACSLTFEGEVVKNNAMIRFLNLSQVQDGTTVTAMPDGNALVIPQKIPSGQDFIEITLSEYGNLHVIAAPHEDLVFEKGKIYYLDVDVSKEGVAEVVVSSTVSWGNSENVHIPGTSTGVNPSPDQPGWEDGDNTSTPGTSTDVNPSPEQPGWGDGGEVELPGKPKQNNGDSTEN